MPLEAVAVIDFETTGMSPGYGARATEIAAIIVRDGQIIDRYQSLMNAGVSVPWFITELTGITNAMVRKAPPARQVMGQVADLLAIIPCGPQRLLRQKFWDAELAGIGHTRQQDFICSMLLARRILPQAPNHKLGTLVDFAKLPVTGRYHRAEADAEMTAHLTLYLERELRRRFGLDAVSCQCWRKSKKPGQPPAGLCRSLWKLHDEVDRRHTLRHLTAAGSVLGFMPHRGQLPAGSWAWLWLGEQPVLLEPTDGRLQASSAAG